MSGPMLIFAPVLSGASAQIRSILGRLVRLRAVPFTAYLVPSGALNVTAKPSQASSPESTVSGQLTPKPALVTVIEWAPEPEPQPPKKIRHKPAHANTIILRFITSTTSQEAQLS